MVENPDTDQAVKDSDVQSGNEQLDNLLKFIKENSDQDQDLPRKLKDYINDSILSQQLGHPDQIAAAILDEVVNEDQKSSTFNAKEAACTNADFKLTAEQEMAVQLFTNYRPDVSADALRSVSSFSLEAAAAADSNGLDWFAFIVLAICQGDAARCQKILSKFWNSPNAVFLWPKKSGNLACLRLSHHIEIILQEEYPIIYQVCGQLCMYNGR